MDTPTEPDPRRIGRDPDAFEAFYREHVPVVSGFIARRVGDPQVAADLTADVFLAAIEASERYHPDRGRPVAWLIGIARNVVADQARRNARELRAVSRVQGRALLDADSLIRVEERLSAAADARRLYAALAALPPDERAVLELVALDGLTVTDVAVVLGVKPVTARVRLHRARRHVRTHLEGPAVPVAPHLTEVSS